MVVIESVVKVSGAYSITTTLINLETTHDKPFFHENA